MRTKGGLVLLLTTAFAAVGGPAVAAVPVVAPPNALTRVVVPDVTFSAYCNGDEWSCFEKVPRAGLSLRQRPDGSLTFIGWVSTRDSVTIKGRWVELSAPDVTPEENVPYQVVIENDDRCLPLRVRYLVNGVPLADRLGNTWFSERATSLDPAAVRNGRVTAVVFTDMNEARKVETTSETRPAPRADIIIPRLSRPQPGNKLSFSVTPHEGVTLGARVTCRWHLVDAAGMEVAGANRGEAADYELTSADVGHWVAVEVMDENGFLGMGRFWFSNLPTVYVDVADGAWPTAAKEEHEARIVVTGSMRFKAQYVDQDGSMEKDGTLIMSQIKVRGNSTAGADKKPYKIKLGKKTDLFGFGKNKHWVLLANCFDESLMRNKLAYDLSAEFGVVSMKSEWVDVVMNGEYVGNYLLCQHIRTGEDRVPVEEWSEEDLTGGYIFEIDAKKAGRWATSPASSQCEMIPQSPLGSLYLALAMNTPEDCFANTAVSNYVCGYWSDVADAWLSGTGHDTKGRHYTELCDLDSMVGYWLSLYVPGNDDAASYSRYAYKPCGGRLFFGPAWDFDYGMGSLQIRARSAVVTNAVGDVAYAPIEPEKWIPATGQSNFMGFWTQDPYFTYRLREKYRAVRPYLAEMVRDGGLIDQTVTYLTPSARANDLRWNNRIGFFGNDHEHGDAAVLKAFLSRRLVWLDSQFDITAAEPARAFANLTATVAAPALRHRPTSADAGVLPDVVRAGWLREQWLQIAAVDQMFAARPLPTTVEGLLAFGGTPSPLGKPMTPWAEYVAGTNPADVDDLFTVSLAMKDGMPEVSWMPDLSNRTDGSRRVYTLRGTDDLATPTAQWESLPVDGQSDEEIRDFCRRHRFFKVEVAMP